MRSVNAVECSLTGYTPHQNLLQLSEAREVFDLFNTFALAVIWQSVCDRHKPAYSPTTGGSGSPERRMTGDVQSSGRFSAIHGLDDCEVNLHGRTCSLHKRG